MTKIIFVCHGNICRSPMAEFVMRDMLEKNGLSSHVTVSSAATSREEIGNPVYPMARAKLAEHGLSCAGKRAVQITVPDMENSDLIIVMDNMNRRNLELMARRSANADRIMAKTHLLLEFARGGEVADPWYTGDFDEAWSDITEGCKGLIEYLKTNKEL